MQNSIKSQRCSGHVKNRNGQMPLTYNAGIHFLSMPNDSNSAQLEINRKYINNMGNVNDVSVLHYQRAAHIQMKNNLEINHFQNIRHQQPQAFVYKTSQFHNHVHPNANLLQNFPVNHPIQKKLVREHILPPDVLHQSNKNVECNSKKSKEFLNQQEAKKFNTTGSKIKTCRKLSIKATDSQEASKLLIMNAADANHTKQKHDAINIREPEEVGDDNGKVEVQHDMEQVLNINSNEYSKSDQFEEINDKSTKDSREKTPMCLINDLARFNKISFQYCLTGEDGPAHCKRFTVTLKLGDEEYTAEGFKIKKAQHLAAKKAIEKTKYKHPTPKTHEILKSNITPTVELNALAMKLGQQTNYIFDEQQLEYNSSYRFHSTQAPANMVKNFSDVKQVQTVYQKRQFLSSKLHSRYTPFQHSVQNDSVPAGRRCFSFASPCRLTLLVGTRQFVGVGKTLQQAKHDAASNALQVLKELMLNEQLKSHEDNVEDNDSKSPISMVFEMGIKRNLPVDFKILGEEGPAHMRTFITACTVGDLKTEGEGNGKKISKKKAAQKMLEELKKLPPLTPVVSAVKRVKLKTSRKKDGDQSKQVNLELNNNCTQKTTFKKVTAESESDNPINKLLLWHQNKKEKEPVFKLVDDVGKENSNRRHFIMEVISNKIVARGVGHSKKMAKQEAAKKCLEAIAESEQCASENDDIAQTKNTSEIKKTVIEAKSYKSSKEETHKTLSQNKKLCQENLDNITTTNCTSSTNVTVVAAMKEPTKATITTSKCKILHMKDQLMYLSNLLGFEVEFSDYPKGNHKEFLTIVMLSTNPPQICHGVGVNAKESQEDAAKNALKILSEMGLNNAVNA